MYIQLWYEWIDTCFRRWNIYKMPWRLYNTTQWWTCSACWELMSMTSYKVRLRIKLFVLKKNCNHLWGMFKIYWYIVWWLWQSRFILLGQYILLHMYFQTYMYFALNYHVLIISFSDAEVTALRAKIHEMRESSMSMEQDCRERVKEEYRDLIKNLLEASGVVKNKLDEFR